MSEQEKTGWPLCELMQDDCRPLSLWFASKLDARALAREAAERLSYPEWMKQVDMYRWRVPQKPPKKPYLTRYYMTMDEGRKRYPEGEPALEWKEVRTVCETPAEVDREKAKGLNPSFPPK